MHGHILMRLEATTTLKSFLLKLREDLYYKIKSRNNNEHKQKVSLPRAKGTINQLFKECLGLIDDLPDVVIFIDEIDYAFKKKNLLGTIRDIVDQTTAVIVLVGMETSQDELLKASTHFFDRCNYFCEFLPLVLNDVKMVCKEVLDITIDEQLTKHIHDETGGNFRQLVKFLYDIEVTAKVKQISHLTAKDYAAA